MPYCLPSLSDSSNRVVLMIEVDIWRAAHKMIELYELDASWRAGLRADQLYDEGEIDGFHAWVRIVKAIKELQHIEPFATDMRH
jgi:hypothetical protein